MPPPSQRLARHLARRRRHLALETALARALWAVPGVGLAVLLATTAGCLSTPLGIAGWVVGGAATLTLLSLVVAPRPLDPRRADGELDAGDALATLLTTGAYAGASVPSVELVARDVDLLVPAARRRLPALPSGKLLLLLLLAGALLLLAITLLPGHRPVAGSGVAAGGGSGKSAAGESGAAGDPERGRDRAAGAGATPETDPRTASPPPGRNLPQPPAKGAAGDGGRAPSRIQDLVVFPDFRDNAPRSQRETAVIERAPVTDRNRRRPSRATRTGPRRARDFTPEWRRRRERALARGTLQAHEGAWLHLYGRCLEAAGPPGRSSGK